jgi:hypothetical protein
MRPTAILALALLAAGVPALTADGPPGTQGIRLDLEADWAPVYCGRELFLFSSGGRNQRMAPGDAAPDCALVQIVPALQPLCGPGGPLALDRDGTLWQLGERTETLLSGLKGAVELFPTPAGPVVLLGRSIRLADGAEKPLPFEALGGQSLGAAGFWIRGAGQAARLAPDGTVRWIWTPRGGSPGPAVLAQDRIAAGPSRGELAVLRDGDGKLLFSYRGGGAVTDPPILAGNRAVYGSLDHFVRAVDVRTGLLAWQFRAQGRVTFGPIPVAAGLLFAESPGKRLFVLSAEKGRKVWEWPLPSGAILSRPAVSGDKAAVLAWGEESVPTLYLVALPSPAPRPAKP